MKAKKRYPSKIAEKLFKAINFIKTAESLHDVIQYAPFHFHGLRGKEPVNTLSMLMEEGVVIELF